MRLLVTGLSRSGTKYLAELLNKAGGNVGHEYVFTVPEPRWGNDSDTLIEVSWLGAPHLDEVDAPVILLYRDPVRCISSMRINMGTGPYLEYAARYGPENLGAHWAHWNRMVLEANPVVMRTEDLPLWKLATMSGLSPVSLARAEQIISKDENHRKPVPLWPVERDDVWETYLELEKRRVRE